MICLSILKVEKLLSLVELLQIWKVTPTYIQENYIVFKTGKQNSLSRIKLSEE